MVIACGTTLSPLLKCIISTRNIPCTIVANTLGDYTVSNDPKDKEGTWGWVQMELISLASAILPDDLTSSPLASLFSMSKKVSIVPLSTSEQFLASWFSESRMNAKTGFDEIHKTFKNLTNYNNTPIDVFPLSLSLEKPVEVRYRNQTGSPRVYQQYGFFDFHKQVMLDPEDLDTALNEGKAAFENLDPKLAVVPAEVEKLFKEADAIIIAPDDFLSLAIMLSNKDLRKAVRKCNGTVLTIAPLGERFPSSEREVPLLKALGVSPDLEVGFLELLRDVSDTIMLDTEDSDVSGQAQDEGYNVVVGDLVGIEDQEEFVSLVLKGAGLASEEVRVETIPVQPDLQGLADELAKDTPSTIPVEQKEGNESDETISNPDEGNVQPEGVTSPNEIDEVAQPSEHDSTVNIPPPVDEEPPRTNEGSTEGGQVDLSEESSPQGPIAEEESASPEKTDPKNSLGSAQDVAKEAEKVSGKEIPSDGERTSVSAPAERTALAPAEPTPSTSEPTEASSPVKESLQAPKAKAKEPSPGKSETPSLPDQTGSDEEHAQPKEVTAKEEAAEKIPTREVLTHMLKELEDDQVQSLEEWVEQIQKGIEEDESYEAQVATSLLNIMKGVGPERVRKNALDAFLKLADDDTSSDLSFKRIILSWLVNHLEDPDFSVQDQQIAILKRIRDIKTDFVGQVLDSFVLQTLNTSSPARKERARTLVLRTAITSKKLSKYVIRSYLRLFEENKVNRRELWSGLSSFDARLVGVELIEGYSVAKSKQVAQAATEKSLGSFSDLLALIVDAYANGDMDQVLSLCGSLSDSALRKARRLSLAQNIKKVGTIPLEILARSLKEDPKELETLVYEMVMNDEISAKLEIVDGRLYIIPIEEDILEEEVPSDEPGEENTEPTEGSGGEPSPTSD